MSQKAVQAFESECKRAQIFVENDMPIGVFHDFLMAIKGIMVDRMVAAHQEQITQAEAAKSFPTHESELPAEEKIEQIPSCCGAAPSGE